MVAKSYQDMEQLCEPVLEDNGKYYVRVKSKTGVVRRVRWYNEKEYRAMYPDEPVDHSKDPYWKSQKTVLGFINGYITIFGGETFEHKDWFKSIGAVYRRCWGWGLSSDLELPQDVPEGVIPIRLDWELVGGEDEKLYNDDIVKAAYEKLVYQPSTSKFQGNIGDRIAVELYVDKAIHLDGRYGPSTMHIMKDANENVYVWTTSAKNWAEGSTHSVRGTIKDHRTYRNTEQTILTRCTENKPKGE